MKIKYKNKSIDLKVKGLSFFGMARGLMFRDKDCDNLLFDFEKKGRFAIHSWFVFFPFLALWLDKQNKVVEHRIVEPFRFCVLPKKEFAKLIEIPLNRENTDVISRFSDGRKV